jgi:hypothetical protein
MKKLLVAGLLAGAVWFAVRPSHPSTAPDEALAGHFGAMCAIAERNIDTPRVGVDLYFAYLGQSSPTMMKQLGDLLVLIERISDDQAHDARARLAHDRLAAVLRPCNDTMNRFVEAIEGDPEAKAKLERGVMRFNRTLEILLGGEEGETLLKRLFVVGQAR